MERLQFSGEFASSSRQYIPSRVWQECDSWTGFLTLAASYRPSGRRVEVSFNPGTMFVNSRAGLNDAPRIGWWARLYQRGERFLLARMRCVVAIATGHSGQKKWAVKSGYTSDDLHFLFFFFSCSLPSCANSTPSTVTLLLSGLTCPPASFLSLWNPSHIYAEYLPLDLDLKQLILRPECL